MKNDNTRELVELSLYAALIIVTVQFIRIPFGPQFVHLGNALVVIAILIFGARKGALVATVALGLFDIFNGYAAEVWITILESLIVCLVLYLVFEKLLKSNDKIVNVIIAGVIAALTKIILNFLSPFTKRWLRVTWIFRNFTASIWMNTSDYHQSMSRAIMPL